MSPAKCMFWILSTKASSHFSLQINKRGYQPGQAAGQRKSKHLGLLCRWWVQTLGSDTTQIPPRSHYQHRSLRTASEALEVFVQLWFPSANKCKSFQEGCLTVLVCKKPLAKIPRNSRSWRWEQCQGRNLPQKGLKWPTGVLVDSPLTGSMNFRFDPQLGANCCLSQSPHCRLILKNCSLVSVW